MLLHVGGHDNQESVMPNDTDTPRKSLDAQDVSPEVKARNKPSGRQYVEPSPLGIAPVEQTGVDVATNPPRSSEHPVHSAEVPLGTGEHAEPPGGGGRESQRKH
jgi:hypothetical protein